MHYEKACKHHLQYDEESDSIPDASVKRAGSDRRKRAEDFIENRLNKGHDYGKICLGVVVYRVC